MAGTGHAALREDALIRVLDLVVEFPAPKGQAVRAVSGVSFDVARGETLGVVGESGCGKTTLGRTIMQLQSATAGTVELDGTVLTALAGKERRAALRAMQMIFQDPVSSLNPSRRVEKLAREGVEIWGDATVEADRIDDLMVAVGLDPATMGRRRPHELSGGQCQRLCLARALAMEPEVLILDEPVSALDVSVQAQILNLLDELKTQFGLTMVFVSHDLAVVKNVADRVMVMYLGKICEIAPGDDLYAGPRHPYTRALLASIPGNQLGLPPASELISGELPSPIDPPSGCRFRTRCPAATELCATEEPLLVESSPGHFTACHHPVEVFPHTPKQQGTHDV